MLHHYEHYRVDSYTSVEHPQRISPLDDFFELVLLLSDKVVPSLSTYRLAARL